ncbi:heterokaryon incompatibility protein-domain-containing protein [Penicillium verhagenii]|uniref:heterokaryon incompatibility protein-domain-containing protein n=1 Tax=Penicillium verhagenii TaxID=1562060 RepID=UPI00254513E6|nr:heterokaryon incompatibility protein-domain-containing protein [Penicillium verhagenii]KAJ5917450.1 heterokaryon incompatibility protein-domain-containing protein [Penicillium verhagenii]
MWLVNAKTFELKSFIDEESPPPYAILSHTWGDPEEEISFQDLNLWATGKDFKGLKRVGWRKVRRACAQALERRLSYIWIDTCCIDKSSSAELQEAINSMFAYYASSAICFAYLVDVDILKPHDSVFDQQFRQARWFTRGWTLQELLAPTKIHFFNRVWDSISDKKNLQALITDITGINPQFMTNPHQASVAERMAWAAKRQTTRREDMAYCLLGLFQVNMPLLYGEGNRAFERLQEEILRSNEDASIHIWGRQGHSSYTEFDFKIESQQDMGKRLSFVHSILLAPHPEYFRIVGLGMTANALRFKPPSFTMGQRGLTAQLRMRADPNYEGIAYAIPNVSTRQAILAIPLISISCGNDCDGEEIHNEYYRPIWCKPIYLSSKFLDESHYEEILIRRRPKNKCKFFNLPFRLDIRYSEKLTLMGVYPPSPVGNTFVLLSKNPARLNEEKFETPGRPITSQNAHVGRRFFHININKVGLVVPALVVVDYRVQPAESDMHAPWDFSGHPRCGCILECRVFKPLGPSFSMETVLSFMKKSPEKWEEIPHKWDGTHKYYNVDDRDNLLEIHVTQAHSEEVPSIVVGLVPRESVHTEGEHRSFISKRQTWRFTAGFFRNTFVGVGSWADYLDVYPYKKDMKHVKKLISHMNHPGVKILVIDDRGLVKEPTREAYKGYISDESEEWSPSEHDEDDTEEWDQDSSDEDSVRYSKERKDMIRRYLSPNGGL